MGMEEVNLSLSDGLSQFGYCRKIEAPMGLDNHGFKTQSFRFPDKRRLKRRVIFDNADDSVDLLGIEIFDQRQDPPFRTVKAGGTA